PDDRLLTPNPTNKLFQPTLNNTFRQRISRLVRESLSFSKKMENHVGETFGILSMTTMHSKAKD
ncbi:MAG: hypothetical protein O9338_14195, partial [Microcystis sp. LE19-251.1A]|nr:hypothetical protein [Microcystis sp. LE19-251.1A]